MRHLSQEPMNLLSIRPPQSWQTPKDHFLCVLEHPWYKAIFLLQDAFTRLTIRFWSTRGVRWLHLPITTNSISSPMGLGSDSLPVQVNLEGVPTYLADSMQFLLEFGCRLAHEGCYYIMPSFRGEDADARHLSQFFHSEAEIPGSLDDVISVIEDYVRFLVEGMLEEYETEIIAVTGTVEHLQTAVKKSCFHRLTFDEAVALLGNSHFIVEHFPGCRSLTREGELQLIALLGDFVWVTHMDHLSVPFYQAFDKVDPTKAKNADLLFGIGETVGAGERHADLHSLKTALNLHKVDEADYLWYCQLRERYPMQTSGFGLGVERFLLWILKHNDIRDIPLLLRFNRQLINP